MKTQNFTDFLKETLETKEFKNYKKSMEEIADVYKRLSSKMPDIPVVKEIQKLPIKNLDYEKVFSSVKSLKEKDLFSKELIDKFASLDPGLYALSVFNDDPKEIEEQNLDTFFSEKNDVEYNERNIKDFKKETIRGNGKREFALIVGNGVSIPYGSETWDDTIKFLTHKVSTTCLENENAILEYFSTSRYSNAGFAISLINKFFDSDALRETLHQCLYNRFSESLLEERDDTLVSVIAQAKRKHKNIPVLTYNYDTFIEKYYNHFEKKRSNSPKYLQYYSGPEYATRWDNNIIHLHGYVSYENKNMSDEIILSMDSYFKTYLSKTDTDWCIEAQKEVLRRYRVLYVGSSMTDLFQLALINEVRAEKPSDFKCYALLCLGNLTSKDKRYIIRDFEIRGIRVIFGNSFKELPKLLKELIL